MLLQATIYATVILFIISTIAHMLGWYRLYQVLINLLAISVLAITGTLIMHIILAIGGTLWTL